MKPANRRGSAALWIIIVAVLVAILGAVVYFDPSIQAKFDAGSTERTMTIDNVTVIYQSAWGHTQTPCRTGGDVVHLDQSVPGESLLITGTAPYTGDYSCGTYNVGASYHLQFDPLTMQRMVITGTRSTTCNANKPYATTSVNELHSSQSLPGDGKAEVHGGDIIVWNTGGAIIIDTTEGRSVISNLTSPVTITVSTGGGNNAGARMKGCEMTLGITNIDVTPVPGTTPPAPATRTSWWDGFFALLAGWGAWIKDVLT